MSDHIEDLIRTGDLDELIRVVDRATESRDWAGVEAIADRCRAAVARGHQLWPVASWAAYLLALLGDAPRAVRALESDAHFTAGPLHEVISVHHGWQQLQDHLSPGPIAALVALECGLRAGVPRGGLLDELDPYLEVPVNPAPWEPTYRLPDYGMLGLVPVELDLPTPTSSVPPAPEIEAAACEPLSRLVQRWVDKSEGQVRAVESSGSAASLVADLAGRSVRWSPMSGEDAVQWLVWAASSGGAHGPRIGVGAGRAAVLVSLTELAGIDEPRSSLLAEWLDRLRWFRWDAGPERGQQLRLAFEDPTSPRAWAIDAVDLGVAL